MQLGTTDYFLFILFKTFTLKYTTSYIITLLLHSNELSTFFHMNVNLIIFYAECFLRKIKTTIPNCKCFETLRLIIATKTGLQ